MVALLVYVDDIVLTGNDPSEIVHITEKLGKAFKIKDLGDLKFFLGFEVAESKYGINIFQWKYTLKLLYDVGFLRSRLVNTPIDHNTRIHHDSRTPLFDPSSYRHLIDRLIHLTNTRHDITYVVWHLSEFVSHPTIAHQQATTHIIFYIKGAFGSSFFFLATNIARLKALSNFD